MLDYRIDGILFVSHFGISEAVRHLIQLGHRHIAFMHLPHQENIVTNAGLQRWKGFEKTMSQAELPIKEKWVLKGPHLEDLISMGHELRLDLLQQHERPSAIVCANDYLAIGVVRAAHQLGISVPRDLSITGHDDTVSGRFISPALTTIAQPMAEAAERAAEQLIEQVKRNPLNRESFKLNVEGRLIKRDSIASPA